MVVVSWNGFTAGRRRSIPCRACKTFTLPAADYKRPRIAKSASPGRGRACDCLPLPHAGRGEAHALPFSRRSFLRPSYLHGTSKSLQTNKGRRSAERRVRGRSAHSERCRPCGFAAPPPIPSPARGGGMGGSPSGALPRLSPTPFGVSSVRSRASWSRTTDPRPGQPAPGRPTFASRASFRTARRWSYEPHPGHRPRSINRPSPVDVPWPSRMISFSSPCGEISRNSGGGRHLFDPTQYFFRALFDSTGGKL